MLINRVIRNDISRIFAGEILLLEQQTSEADRMVEDLKQSVDTVKAKVCPLLGPYS